MERKSSPLGHDCAKIGPLGDIMTEDRSFTGFVEELDRVVQNLYDPAILRKSGLGVLFGLDTEANPARLRQAILDGVEALKPQSSIGDESKAWRAYRVLLHRYVEQFPRADVARTLGLSVRQLTREDSRAVRVLADYLWSQYVDAQGANESVPTSGGPSQEQELEWLRSSLPNEAIDIAETIQTVIKTVSPLAQELGVDAEISVTSTPAVAGQSSTLRQALLDVLTTCMRAAPRGKMTVETTVAARRVQIVVSAYAAHGDLSAPVEQQTEGLDMARRLLALMGGELQVSSFGDQGCSVVLSLDQVEQTAVLVIDDNADTVQLFRRYLAGTRYPFHACREPSLALQTARDLRPQIIVLDVMLPGVDGWQLLQQLREDPATRHIPVILCSILPEEHLALTLGAAGYLRKPVTRAVFLAALDRQAALLAQGSSA